MIRQYINIADKHLPLHSAHPYTFKFPRLISSSVIGQFFNITPTTAPLRNSLTIGELSFTSLQ